MKRAAKPSFDETNRVNVLPHWITSARGEVLETVAFSSGAALAMLDLVVLNASGTLPGALLRDRMALDAAAACLKLEGRHENTSDIRDAVSLTRAGDALGPAGEMYMAWRNVARINLKNSSWPERLKKVLPEQVSEAMQMPTSQDGSPAAKVARALAEVLRAFPRQEAAALMLSDVVLARALGWAAPVPLLASHLPRREVRSIATGEGDSLRAVHAAIIAGSDEAIRMASDLSRRAAKLYAIAPKLRAKGAEAALTLFLNFDAVSPSGMLSPWIKGTSLSMTDRAARRFCDRLVELGVVRELTGRPTFRLYGL